jgi:hypothetical protein
MKRPTVTAFEYSVLALALPAFAACGGVEADDAPETAQVRVVHAAPDSGAVDIHAEGNLTPLISNLQYGQVTDYLELPPGTYNLQVRPTGRLDEPLFETGDVTLEIGASITAVATGFVDTDDDDAAFRVLALKDAFADAGASSARIRIVHASADAPTVGIDVGNDNPAEAEIKGLDRFADTGAAGIDLPAGAELQVGITAGDQRVTAFTTPALPDGAPLYVIAAGRLVATPDAAPDTELSLFAVGPDGLVGIIPQNPFIYALHASPDAPAVDLRSGGQPLASNLSYGQLGRIQVAPGTATLDVYAAGGSTSVYSDSVSGLTAGESYLAIAAGFLAPQPDEGTFRLIALANELGDPGDGARLQVIHASPDAPAVDISTLMGAHLAQPLLVSGLRFGELTAAAGLAVPALALDLGIAPAGVPTPVATFGIAPAHGDRGFVIAAGALSPLAGQQAFSLMVVNTSVTPWSVTSIAPH